MDIPLGALFGVLIVLLLLSGFFSGSETGMMALNRYRLRHLTESGHPGAKRVTKLLARPDRLIGLILVGNNFVNILASYVALFIALELLGEPGIAVAAILLPIVILIFSEVTPKTLAAIYPERFAFPASYVLGPLLKILYPFVWVINAVANRLLRLMGVSLEEIESTPLSREELRTVVNEAGTLIPQRNQKMLINILDLENVTVDDIMIPRNELTAIDLDDPIEEIMEQIASAQHTRLLVYRGDINNIIGIFHQRRTARLFKEFDKASCSDIEKLTHEAYFVPEGTPLHIQLVNFQRRKRRIALIVDEYGDVQGLVTIEDILEEIVGEFTSDPDELSPDVHPQKDGTFIIDGSATIRELNRSMQWALPTDGPKTLNGVILEYLESIPEPGTSLMLNGYPVEIVKIADNAVKTARINPALRKEPNADPDLD